MNKKIFQDRLGDAIHTRLDKETDLKIRKEAERNSMPIGTYLRVLIKNLTAKHGFVRIVEDKRI